MKPRILIICIAFLLFNCRGRKESVYIWNGEEESRKLTLLSNDTFILEIDADYYYRIDTGTYRITGDTLIINPDKKGHEIESVQTIDSLYMGQRFLEVMDQEIIFDTSNVVVDEYYRRQIFPNVVVNNSIALEVSPDDASYNKLIIPDSIEIHAISITVLEENTCVPRLTYHIELDKMKQTAKSYRVSVRSRKDQENYLAGFKWIMKGESIESFFSNEDCESMDIKLVRKR